MTRAALRRALAAALAAFAFAVGLAVGIASTPTVVRTTFLACDGSEPLTLESRRGLLERIR